MARWQGGHGGHRIRMLRAVLCSLAGGLWLAAPVPAAQDPSLEYRVKAAFLLNFTKFIEWPATAFADANSPFTICVLGKDPFGRALDDAVEGESFGTHKLTVRRINEPPLPQACQVLFIRATEEELSPILGEVGRSVLTVGEGAGFVHEGGIIAFVLDNRRVRFDINQSAAERAGLKLSSKLLSVARAVER
jgi:hypothetical protein